VSNPESEWLARAQSGDDEAFSHLVETYQAPVFNMCYRMLGDPAEAEDAAQESFWRAYQYIKRYDPTRSFMTWLLSIAAHYCIDQVRKRHAVMLPMDIVPEEAFPDDEPGPETSFSRREEQNQLRQLLDKLNPQDRAAIILRYWYDMSEEEISQSLSLTVSAVKSRLHRARVELARLYQTSHGVPALSGSPIERRHHESPAL
jgi:RNA polymerase sigma-70 factor, ECF subfamily